MNNHYTTESSPDGEERENEGTGGRVGWGDEPLQPERRQGRDKINKHRKDRGEGQRFERRPKQEERGWIKKLICPSTRVGALQRVSFALSQRTASRGAGGGEREREEMEEGWRGERTGRERRDTKSGRERDGGKSQQLLNPSRVQVSGKKMGCTCYSSSKFTCSCMRYKYGLAWRISFGQTVDLNPPKYNQFICGGIKTLWWIEMKQSFIPPWVTLVIP